MLPKAQEHKQAILLRKQGLSYSEILKHINVSQSTLSLWLGGLELSQENKDLLAQKKYLGQLKGAKAKRTSRIKKEEMIKLRASQEIEGITQRELWLLGIVAYWCEGAKQRDIRNSQQVIFVNSDPFLIKLFVKWLRDICKISQDDILYSLYIHENAKIPPALTYWRDNLCLSEKELYKVCLKKHKISTNRKYQLRAYYGLVRVVVRRSSDFNRKISGWVLGINNSV